MENQKQEAEKLSDEERQMIEALRDRGFAVVVFTPEELQGAESGRVEDRLVELGWDVIETLSQELTQFCVVYRDAGYAPFRLGFNCWAKDADHAKEQCLNAYPSCEVIEVNEGFGNMRGDGK